MITVVGNLKGGCGKSTVTFNLAVWLAGRQVEVAAFDLDPQATLSEAAEVRAEMEKEPTLCIYRPDHDPAKLIKQHLNGEILIDVGAANSWAMRLALQMAQRVLVPVTPSQADVWATQRFLRTIDETFAGLPNRPEVLMFLNRADTHPGLSETRETEEALATLVGGRVLPCRLCQRTAFRRSFSEGLAVFEMPGNSKAAEEVNQLAALLYPNHAAG